MNQDKHLTQNSNRSKTFTVTISLGTIFVLVTFFWGYFGNQWNSRIDRSIALFELSAGTTEFIKARWVIFGDLYDLHEDPKLEGEKLKKEDLQIYVKESMQNEEFRNNLSELLNITLAVANCSNSKLCDQFVSCKLFYKDAEPFWSASKDFYINEARWKFTSREIQKFIDDCLEYFALEREGKDFWLSAVRLFPILSPLKSRLIDTGIRRGSSEGTP